MVFFCLLAVSCLPAISFVANAYEKARPAAQYNEKLDSPLQYRGGWPLALSGASSLSCPVGIDVVCASGAEMDSACCPTGQFCFVDDYQGTHYCCPTDTDCKTAVNDFPTCADAAWNMFHSPPDGYFCCSPDHVGVVDMTTTKASLCEPADTVVLQTLLARQAAATSGAVSNDSGSGSSTSARTAVIIGLVVGLGLGALLMVGFFLVRRQIRGRDRKGSFVEDLNYPCTPWHPLHGDRVCKRHRCVHAYRDTSDSNAGGGG